MPKRKRKKVLRIEEQPCKACKKLSPIPMEFCSSKCKRREKR